MYGQGRMVVLSHAGRRALNVRGSRALDLRTLNQDGTPWDFRKNSDRDYALQLIETEDPDWSIGSPPCTAFRSWNQFLNFKKDA